MFIRLSKIASILSVIVTWSLSSQLADAAILKVHMTGQVTDWDGGLGAQFSVGDQLNLDYSFDSQAVDRVPNLSEIGTYDLLSFEGSLGNYIFKSTQSHLDVFPKSFPFGDQYFAQSDSIFGVDVAGANLAVGAIVLRDYDSTFLNGDLLPLSAPNLSIMEVHGFALGFDHPVDGRILVRAELDSASIEEVGSNTVPEPSSLLVLVGLSLTMIVKRHRKS